jgi:spermidine synthase
VEDLDRQIVALFAQQLLLLLLGDDPRAVMGVDDVVAHLEDAFLLSFDLDCYRLLYLC